MSRKRPGHESPEIGKTSARFMRALVRRAAEGDTEALEELLKLSAVLEAAQAGAMAGLHAFGYSYGEIAGVAGTSRQAVAQRLSRHATAQASA